MGKRWTESELERLTRYSALGWTNLRISHEIPSRTVAAIKWQRWIMGRKAEDEEERTGFARLPAKERTIESLVASGAPPDPLFGAAWANEVDAQIAILHSNADESRKRLGARITTLEQRPGSHDKAWWNGWYWGVAVGAFSGALLLIGLAILSAVIA